MLAWLKRIFHMTDTVDDVVAPAVLAPVSAPAVVQVDFDKLKALLIAYGHAIGTEYEQFVAMVKK